VESNLQHNSKSSGIQFANAEIQTAIDTQSDSNSGKQKIAKFFQLRIFDYTLQ
jgi:hypothetical protein